MQLPLGSMFSALQLLPDYISVSHCEWVDVVVSQVLQNSTCM